MREENGSELSISKVLFEFLRLLVKILIVLIIVETFVMKGYRIPSSSMEETLLPGDYVLVERMSKWDEAPKRSDIVVFRYPRDFREDYIKRVVALPGDELILQAGKLVLNGEIIDEPYASYRKILPYSGKGLDRNLGPLLVPEGEIFVMGDNRDSSFDSRNWGCLSCSELIGRAVMIYWPPERFGPIDHERIERR